MGRVLLTTFLLPQRISRINREPKLGTQQIGAPADVAIFDLVAGPVTFVDTRGSKREGKVYLRPIQTVRAGVPFRAIPSSPSR